MRLIDADALKTKKVYSEERHEKVVPVAEIDWMPTVDAVEVIRCVNCKWFQDEQNEFSGSDGFCPNVAHGVSVDWFCADGERRE